MAFNIELLKKQHSVPPTPPNTPSVLAKALSKICSEVEQLAHEISELTTNHNVTPRNEYGNADYTEKLRRIQNKVAEHFSPQASPPLTMDELQVDPELQEIHLELSEIEKNMLPHFATSVNYRLVEAVKPSLENAFEELLHAHKSQPYFLSRVFKLLMECDSAWKRDAVMFAIEDFFNELEQDNILSDISVQSQQGSEADILHST